MPASASFADLFRRLEQGDPAAGEEVVCRFGPRLLRHIRTRLRFFPRRLFDSLDIFQSVLRRLFQRVGRPGSTLRCDTPERLHGLLQLLALENVVGKLRRRENRVPKLSGGLEVLDRLPATTKGPVEIAMEHDLLELARQQCRPDEWQMLLDWYTGYTQQEIADRQGNGLTSEAVRKRVRRALKRLSEMTPTDDEEAS